MTDRDETALLLALRRQPGDRTTRLIYADWLDEHGRAYEALLQRVKAGVSQVRYKLRRKSNGLFSDGDRPIGWSAKGKEWPKLTTLKGHMTSHARGDTYGQGTPWTDVEVVVIEVRVHLVGTLPYSFENLPPGRGRRWRSPRKAVVEVPPALDEE